MKKVLSFLLTCTMVCSLFPAPALAEAVEQLDMDAQREGESVGQSSPEETRELGVAPSPAEMSDREGAVEVEPLGADAALDTQDADAPYEIWIEGWEDYGDGTAYWSSNSYLNPATNYRICARSERMGDPYTWQNATDTISFVPTDPNAVYRVGHTGPFTIKLNADRTHFDGLFYEENGLMLPLPAGTYYIVFSLTEGEYSTAQDERSYTVDESMAYIHHGFYEMDANDEFTRNNMHVRKQNSEDELGLVDINDPLDLEFSVLTATAMGTTPAIGSSDQNKPILRMYEALDQSAQPLTMEQLKSLYMDEDLSAWPSPLSWSQFKALPITLVWERTTTTAGSNGTTWQFSKTGSTEGTFAIHGIRLGTRVGTEPALKPGVYFPVLRVSIDGQLYHFAYNPIEVGTVERQAPTITTGTLPAAMRGLTYSTPVKARSGVPTGTDSGTCTWAVTQGSLPAGLELDHSEGTISGTPTQSAQTSTFTLTLTETVNGSAMTASKEFTITVRDQVTLGEISYSQDTIWFESNSNKTLHLSVPISADISDAALDLAESEVNYAVYQTSRGSSTSTGLGATVLATPLLSSDKQTLEIDAPIDYTTATIDRIEVNLRLKDNRGKQVMVPKENDTTGEGDWAIITASVEDPGITIGSYVYAPALTFNSSKPNLPTQGRMRLWSYTENGTAVPADAQEHAITTTVDQYNDSFKLLPGTYVLTVEGGVSVYDVNGNDTGQISWIDILGGIKGGEAIAGTRPVQYKFTVGPNVGSRLTPGLLDITYSDKNVVSAFTHRVNAVFQQENPEEYAAEDVAYDVVWYRRKGASESDDVSVATGPFVEFGPSPYDLYVQVVPTGRGSSFWKTSDKVKVEQNTQSITVQVPRKGLFKGRFTVACPDGQTPQTGQHWGIVEVRTPIASGGYVSANYWPTKEADDNNVVTIPNLTSGSIITFTPRVELKGGQVTYTVPEETTADFTHTLTVPPVDGLVTFGDITFTDVDGKAQQVRLDDGLTGVSVARVENGTSRRKVPFFVADGNSIILLPETNQNYYHNVRTGNEVTYEVTITRRSGDAKDRWGTTAPDYVARTAAPIEVRFAGDSGNVASQTKTVPATSLTAHGYARFTLENTTKRLYTLLLYNDEGALVESGPVAKMEYLRTPHLDPGNYTIYAVDSDALPQDRADYTTKGALTSRVLGGDKAERGTSLSFAIEDGKATNGGNLILPKWNPAVLVDQSKSFVSVKTAYANTLSVQMHAELGPGVVLGNNAYLEVSTNQETNENGGYLAPKALTLNGIPVALNRWDTLFCTGPDLVADFTGHMEHGDLAINLARARELNDKFAQFPLDMTLVIPRTISGYAEASVWLVQNKGANSEKRTLIGSYQSDAHEATITAPQVAAWKTFSVYGDAGPNANVTVFLNGMRAATTVANAYGYYEAEVTLPDNVEDFDEFSIYAAAQWTRGVGANEVGYMATTETAKVVYSTTFPAIERVTLCYQPDVGEDYKYMVAYDKGRQPSKYLTAYAAERVDKKEEGAEHAKDFWLVEYANGSDIDTVSIDAVRGNELIPLTVTDDLSTASGWVPDIAKAGQEEQQGNDQQNLVSYGWYYGQSAGRIARSALKDNGTDGKLRSFITSPRYFEFSPEDLNIECTLKSMANKYVPTEPVRGALDTGSYAGWKGDGVTQQNLAEYLGNMSQGGRMWVASDDDIDALNGTGDLNASAVAEKLFGNDDENEKIKVNEWLILGNGNTTGGASQKLIGVHHTVKSTPVEDIRSAMQARLAAAKEVTDAYEAFWYDDVEPANPVYHNGEWVVEAGGVRSTGSEGMPYFIETAGQDGNVTAEWLQKYYIDEGNGETNDSKYVWCLTTMSKQKYQITRWDEKNNERVDMVYELPEGIEDAGRLTYYEMLEQWGVILECVTAGLIDGMGESLTGQSDSAAAARDALFNPPLVPPALSGQSLSVQAPPSQPKKSWWEKTKDFVREALGDSPDNSTHAMVQQGQHAGDVTAFGNPNDKAWTENKQQLESGTLGGANALGTKAKKSKEIVEKGGVELVKELTSHTPGPVGQIAGGVYWYEGHDKWLKQKWGDIGTFSWNKEKDYQTFKKGLYDLKNGARPDQISVYFWSLYSKYSQDTIDEWSARFWSEMELLAKSKKESPMKKKDPSGIVYEAVLSNPVAGATVKLYTFNATAAANDMDPAQFMDSHLFGVEDNPQTTGADGRYQWFVPEGYWQVRVTKDGYEDFSTGDWGREEEQPVYDEQGQKTGTQKVMVGDYGLGATKNPVVGGVTYETSQYWMPVLPVQLDVNIGLVSTEAPTIESVEADEAGVTVKFSKYVKVDDVTVDLFKLDGKTPAGIEALDADVAGDGSGVTLARTFRLTYPDGVVRDAGGNVNFSFNDEAGKVQSYASVGLAASDRTRTETVGVASTGNVKRVAAPTATNRVFNGAAQVGVPEGEGYTLEGTGSATAVGSYRVVAKLLDGYAWSDNTRNDRTFTWSIAAGQVTSMNVALAQTQVTYNGSAHTPAVTVTFGGKTLKAGTDYAVSYANNVNAGTATVTVTGKGGYAGTRTATFAIAKAANGLDARAGEAREVLVKKVKKKAQKVASGIEVVGAVGAVSFEKASGAGNLSVAADGKITVKKKSKKKTYRAVVRVTAAGDANHEAASREVAVVVRVVDKYTNPIAVEGRTATVKAGKSAAAKKLVSVRRAKGKVTYKKASGNKKITVAANGKVSVRKGTKPGTYKLKLKVTAAGNGTYKKATKTAVCYVVVP